jgi:hypothetical protein
MPVQLLTSARRRQALKTFIEVQQKREESDYDTAKEWGQTDVEKQIDAVGGVRKLENDSRGASRPGVLGVAPGQEAALGMTSDQIIEYHVGRVERFAASFLAGPLTRQLARQNTYFRPNWSSRMVFAEVTTPNVAALRASAAGAFQLG